MGTNPKGIELPKNVYLEPKSNRLFFKKIVGGKPKKRKLDLVLEGTKQQRKEILAIAKEKAHRLRMELIDGTFDLRIKEEAGKESVQDVLTAWESYVKGTSLGRRHRIDCPATVRRVAKVLFPRIALSKLPLSRFFSSETVKDWAAHRTALANEKIDKGAVDVNDDVMYRARNSIAAEVRQLRALWSEEAMGSRAYRQLLFDESAISEFKKKPRIRSPKAKLFDPPSQRTVERWHRLMQIAERHRPDLWLTASIGYVTALRRGYALFARWEYFKDSVEPVLQEDGSYSEQRVVRYYFTGSNEKPLKTGTETNALVPVDVYERMLRHKDPACPYVIPFPLQSERDKRIREVTKWLKRIGVTDRRPFHWLRKWCGATYASQGDIGAAALQLGDSDLKTIKQRYHAILNPTKLPRMMI